VRSQPSLKRRIRPCSSRTQTSDCVSVKTASIAPLHSNSVSCTVGAYRSVLTLLLGLGVNFCAVEDTPSTRRSALLRAGGLLAGALGVGGWKVATSDGAGPAAVASGEVTCVLMPEQTEGPYYIDGEKLRRNI